MFGYCLKSPVLFEYGVVNGSDQVHVVRLVIEPCVQSAHFSSVSALLPQ